ncbi:MAG: hypothetical protein HRU24_13335 [Gammaproteobacteria bacterium]|nr:hypothetical protein [Gammaproteobacteria bacterium]
MNIHNNSLYHWSAIILFIIIVIGVVIDNNWVSITAAFISVLFSLVETYEKNHIEEQEKFSDDFYHHMADKSRDRRIRKGHQ